jgi:copper chaperone CopZ
MACDSCALHVTRALQGIEGVSQVLVPGWAAGRATLTTAPSISDEQFANAVASAGYRATVLSHRDIIPPEPPEEWGRGADVDLAVIGTGGVGMAAAI